MEENKNNQSLESNLKEENKTGKIIINSREKRKKETIKLLEKVAIISLLIIIPLVASYLITNNLIDRKLKFLSGNATDQSEIIGKVYNREEWRHAYESASPNMVGVAREKGDFDMNDYKKVTNGLILDESGNIAIPLEFINESTRVVYIKIPNKHRDNVFEANLVGIDKTSGVAIINSPTVKAKAQKHMNENELKLADTILLIAAPFGNNDYGNLKNGTIHTKGMLYTVTDADKNLAKVKCMIGSFPIDVSNNGGQVIGVDGKMIGISSSYLTESLGLKNTFAIIPIAELENIAKKIITKNNSTSYIFGVKGNFIKHEKLNAEAYYVLETIQNTTASRGGIVPTDMILSIDGKTVSSKLDINSYIKTKKIGENVTVRIERKGVVKDLVMKVY